MNKRLLFCKVIAVLIAFAMMLGSVASLRDINIGFAVMAEGDSNDAFPENVYVGQDGTSIVLGKDAYLTEDGTYTVDLSAYAVGQPVIQQRTAKVATDFIIVMDMSNSMNDTYMGATTYHYSALMAATKAFVSELNTDSTVVENPEWNLDHRVAIVTYASGPKYSFAKTGIYKTEKNGDEFSTTFYRYGDEPGQGEGRATEIYDNAFMSVVDEYDEVIATIDACQTGAFTYMNKGMEMAWNIVDKTPENTTEHYNEYYDQGDGEWKERPKVVILFTDGVSGNLGYNQQHYLESIGYANQIKGTGAKIFTVGLISNRVFDRVDGDGMSWFSNGSAPYTGGNMARGELQVSSYTFREFERNVPLKNGGDNYFAGYQKLLAQFGSDEAALEKYIEVQKNQYRIMGLSKSFLAMDALVAISSEYDNVEAQLVTDYGNPDDDFGSDWVRYNKNGVYGGWYTAARSLDLRVDGELIGSRYAKLMTDVLDASPSIGTSYTSANAIWKKQYKSTTETLLTLDPSDNTYKEMSVEVPAVNADGSYIMNPNLKYFIPLTNAYDIANGLGTDNIANLVTALKQIEEVAFTEIIGYSAGTGMTRLSSITDKISENFVLPDDFADDLDKYVEIYTANVDSTAMKAEGSTNLSNVQHWIFQTPVRINTNGVTIANIPENGNDNDLESSLYAGGFGVFNPGIHFDRATGTITVVGFRWAAGSWYCGMSGANFNGKKLIVRIKGLTAKDNIVPGSEIPTNSKGFSGMKRNWRDTRPSSYETRDNGTELLLFPEPTVKIREKTLVYDYGFKLIDNDLPGLFAEQGETETDVKHLLSIDYMYASQRNSDNGITYHGTYPYNGAKGRDIYGSPITYGTDIAHDQDGFKIGFMIDGNEVGEHSVHPTHDSTDCVGYFEPHTISHRDYIVAALLEINGTQKDVFGSSLKRYEWCRLNIAPASNVLYEAEQGVSASNLNGNFVSYQNSSLASNESWSWSVEGSFDTTATQQHYNKLYGNDPVYNGKLNCDANGASMKVTVDQDLYEAVKATTATWPVAKFSFKGSGFSFTSRCGIDTGIFIVDVVPKGQDQKYNNTAKHPATGDYTPVEGDNYHTLVNTRYYGGSETPNGSALLRQIPVFRRGHMPYQDYDVYLTPVYFPAWANDPTQNVSAKSGEEVSMRLDKIIPGIGDIEYTITNAMESGEGEATRAKYDSFTSYIDTIRIYHPLGAKVHAKDTDAVAYYHADEMNAKYIETRTLLIKNPPLSDGNINGAIFLDYGPASEGGEQHFDATNPTTYTVSDYVKFGPNNEMYLKGMTGMPDGSSKGGSFTFSIANPGMVRGLQISMKAYECESITANVTLGFAHSTQTKTITVSSSTEMYYDLLKELTPGNFSMGNLRTINIACTGEGMLSIVNLKIVYNEGYVETSETDSVNPNIVTNLETVEFANAIAFGVKGDANGDNAADMTDALLIMRKSLGSDIEFGISATYLSDVNEDGAIDLADALSTMRLALN